MVSLVSYGHGGRIHPGDGAAGPFSTGQSIRGQVRVAAPHVAPPPNAESTTRSPARSRPAEAASDSASGIEAAAVLPTWATLLIARRRLLGERALPRGVDLRPVADDPRRRVGALQRGELRGVGAVEHLVGLPADRRRLLLRVAAGVAQLERLAVLG